MPLPALISSHHSCGHSNSALIFSATDMTHRPTPQDEFGSGIRHSADPSLRVAPFLFVRGGGEPVPFSVAWPVKDIAPGKHHARSRCLLRPPPPRPACCSAALSPSCNCRRGLRILRPQTTKRPATSSSGSPRAPAAAPCSRASLTSPGSPSSKRTACSGPLRRRSHGTGLRLRRPLPPPALGRDRCEGGPVLNSHSHCWRCDGRRQWQCWLWGDERDAQR